MANEFTAQARYVRVSPQKARLVLNLIKGQRVETALSTLAFTKKGIAPAVLKLLRSALENANYLNDSKGLDVDVDRLYVARAVVNEGPRMKRVRPAPMGRAYRYQRRMSHLEIALAERKSAEKTGEGEHAPKTVTAKALAKKAAPAKKPVAKKAPAKKKK